MRPVSGKQAASLNTGIFSSSSCSSFHEPSFIAHHTNVFPQIGTTIDIYDRIWSPLRHPGSDRINTSLDIDIRCSRQWTKKSEMIHTETVLGNFEQQEKDVQG
ncbi:hypothetical protein V6N11_032246 [Hibiscus sabdariffa]|uniref:Uncharacterized protein n=1 Tax=Hibiscus sabdariffa TaxID=183260 RepID=A0ABR2T033_9ROSI